MPFKKDAATLFRIAARRLDPPAPAATPQQPLARPKAGRKGWARPSTVATVPSAPGERAASNFFDAYPRFYEGESEAWVRRSNLRYQAIFGEFGEIFDGARVLDIGCHDGRWCLAALANGAKSAVGIEARPEFVEAARTKVADYGFGEDRARFVHGSVYEVLAESSDEFDVVLCLGYLYHTLRYNELFSRIRATNPTYVVIDSRAAAVDGERALIYPVLEGEEFQGNAVLEPYSYGDLTLTGRPNLKAMQLIMEAYGYELQRQSDWTGILRDNGSFGAKDYAGGQRTTVLFADPTRER